MEFTSRSTALSCRLDSYVDEPLKMWSIECSGAWYDISSSSLNGLLPLVSPISAIVESGALYQNNSLQFSF